ncbi:MAG: glycine cleavage system aminomethyltransferase GcvT [Sphaerochaetaceae bacterium]|jgi:aminomethyltransferase|nr:glycine cleavage system aminomethyltransferase GcvT [Sphaerochaetaceae bacterium]
MRQTPLYDEYATYEGVKMVDFGGWELPLHFGTGITAEHHAVRQKAGLFDISHMGECMISGPGATEYLDYLVTNSVSAMEDGQIMYTFMCYPNGTVVDDLIIFRLSSEDYWVVMNAANTAKDLAWITSDNPKVVTDSSQVKITDFSPQTVLLALQGPRSERILAKICPEVTNLSFFRFIPDAVVAGIRCIVSRNGYTGEDGFEIYCNREHGQMLWRAIIESGQEDGLIPCGLGARDTLRLEAKLPLYGHEISDEITPLEANLGVFVKFDKADFCGKEALSQQHLQGVPRSLRGFEMLDASVPRNGQRVFLGDEEIGFVTSGTKSPTLGIFCGYMLVSRHSGLSFGDVVELLIHGKRKRAKLVKTPFYKRTPQKKL